MRMAFGASILAVFAVVATVLSTGEALEERQAAAEAVDLQLAAMTVSTSYLLDVSGGGPSVDDLHQAVRELGQNHDLALHSLEPDEKAQALALIDEIGLHGTLLLDPAAIPHAPHGHDELQRLLETASNRASSDAADAERNAVFAVLGAILALVLAASLVIRSRYQAQRERSISETQIRAGKYLEALLNDSPDIFFVVGPDSSITYRSASATRLLDAGVNASRHVLELVAAPEREALKSHLAVDSAVDGSATFEMTDLDGNVGWFDLRVSDLTNNEVVGGRLITARDVTNEVRLQNELRRQATTDLLTGLRNRRALQPSLDRAKDLMEASGKAMALMTLDLDGFKAVNDTHGHHAGDELLALIASRLKKVGRPGETLLRLGGDEFAMIMPSVSGSSEAKMAAHRLLAVLDEPFRIGDRTELLRTSIGVTIATEPEQVALVVHEADTAMYASKRRGGDAVTIFHPSMDIGANRESKITRALRAADFDAEFRVVYQPIVVSATTEIIGVEALLRWTSPSIGVVRPDEFIPLAEAAGEICAIGDWVLNAVCHQVAVWNEAGIDPGLTVSVNVSPCQLEVESFVHGVLATAAAWSVRPEQLVVEVTESVMLDETGKAPMRLEKLRQAGVRISIDDFGSGYSNLGQLLSIPFDIIKVDRSLLLTLSAMREQAGGDERDSCAIMESIVSIATVLGAPVICEGVETEEQRASLVASGISHVQGYLTGRPVSPELITRRLLMGQLTSSEPRALAIDSSNRG